MYMCSFRNDLDVQAVQVIYKLYYIYIYLHAKTAVDFLGLEDLCSPISLNVWHNMTLNYLQLFETPYLCERSQP